jgi:protocatechuate 3,4-dioxygenase beta subunit
VLLSGVTVVKTTATDANGAYSFSGVEPGNYTVKETNPAGYPLDVSDYDTSNDGDVSDTNKVVDNLIGVTLNPGEKDGGNDFVDSNNGAITGTVKDDNGNPIANVPIQLQSVNGNSTTVVGSTHTDSKRRIQFRLAWSRATTSLFETNLPAFPA